MSENLKNRIEKFFKDTPDLSTPTPSLKKDFSSKRVLITAGATIEDIDPVRYISNRSSGKMGVAIAKEAALRGAEVTFIHASLHVPVPALPNLTAIAVRSADDMYQAVMSKIQEQDLAIFVAAVCDFKPKRFSEQKLKKRAGRACPLNNIEWVKTPDILAAVGKLEKRPFLVGFAAESEDIIKNAKKKLTSKKCDMICVNDISKSESGFEVDNNQITLITNSKITPLPLMTKDATAEAILSAISKAL
ncbi:MAG: bifunctional phosphopantothenoylcysteine decarboxylase/phosphopantothenate--cysteine ligase CoaBC [Bdellovibrionota bacterium]